MDISKVGVSSLKKPSYFEEIESRPAAGAAAENSIFTDEGGTNGSATMSGPLVSL